MTVRPTPVRRVSDTPTIGEIREHLQLAIEIEHATIPAYLTAMFSLHDGSNIDAEWIIRSVVTEEMLHMTLASNVLNAIGGSPAIANPAFVPSYPMTLPHFSNSPIVETACFSRKNIRSFIEIERRVDAEPDPPPVPGASDFAEGTYGSIGQFYDAIIDALKQVCDTLGEPAVFTGSPAKQITPDQYYGSEGRLIEVTDLDSALEAMNEIIEQGEGNPPKGAGEDEGYFALQDFNKRYVAHLYRFYEIFEGRYYADDQRPSDAPDPVAEAVSTDELPPPDLPTPRGRAIDVDWDAVWPIRPNVKIDDYPIGSEIRDRLEAFARLYSDMLRTLHRAFNGEPQLIAETVPTMYQLRYFAQDLCRIPSGDGVTTVGPAWEFVD